MLVAIVVGRSWFVQQCIPGTDANLQPVLRKFANVNEVTGGPSVVQDRSCDRTFRCPLCIGHAHKSQHYVFVPNNLNRVEYERYYIQTRTEPDFLNTQAS